jgi:hypothetical protein
MMGKTNEFNISQVQITLLTLGFVSPLIYFFTAFSRLESERVECTKSSEVDSSVFLQERAPLPVYLQVGTLLKTSTKPPTRSTRQ